jgi:thiol-disulfide isomerase/thioredoxin
MANLVAYINTFLKPYYKYIIGFFLIVLFITIARYAYDTYFVRNNKNKKFSNVANANNTSPVMGVYFFHVDWCPHCVKAVPEWNTFMEQYHNKTVNGHLVQCYDIDCTDDNGDYVIQFDPSSEDAETGIQPTPIKISELIKKYNIDSYPTIKLTIDDTVVEFDAKVSRDNLVKFVNSM